MQARRTFKEPYECKFDWPEDCFCQCGDSGLVLKELPKIMKKALNEINDEDVDEAFDVIDQYASKEPSEGSYITAFFEAFPRSPDTFIRGEGITIEKAELSAWNKYQKYLSCVGHEFERRGYTNGAGFCKKCGMFGSKVFEPIEE